MVALGFEGKVGQTLLLPVKDGPTLVAVGVGDALAGPEEDRQAAAALGLVLD